MYNDPDFNAYEKANLQLRFLKEILWQAKSLEATDEPFMFSALQCEAVVKAFEDLISSLEHEQYLIGKSIREESEKEIDELWEKNEALKTQIEALAKEVEKLTNDNK